MNLGKENRCRRNDAQKKDIKYRTQRDKVGSLAEIGFGKISYHIGIYDYSQIGHGIICCRR